MPLVNFSIRSDAALATWQSPTAARLRLHFETIDAYELKAHGATVWKPDESGIEVFKANETRGLTAYSSFIGSGQPYKASIIDTSTGKTVWDTTGTITVFPKTITRGPYSFTAYNADEERQLNDFLGISPAGIDIDTYVAGLTNVGFAAWKIYWIGIWTEFQRPDMISFVNTKTAAPAPPPTPPPAPPTPPTPPPTRTILDDIWDYFTKTVPEFYGSNPDALLIPFSAIAQGLEGLGALFTGTKTVASAEGQAIVRATVPDAIAKEIISKTWLETIKSHINIKTVSLGITAVFAISEYPNLMVMTQFARNQIAASTGNTLPQVQAQLTSLENSIKNAGYDFSTALKAGKTTDAAAILAAMQASLAQYRTAIDNSAKWLTDAGTLNNTNAIYDLDAATIAAFAAQLPAAPTTLEAQLTESMDVEISKITDGDTVQATTQTFPPIVFTIRILGENAPDKDLSVYWVKSLIDGVEKRYELKAADYKASNAYAVTNLMRTYCTLKIDPANKMDKYGRVLAAIKYGPGKADFALDMIRKGLAVCYFVDTNKYVDTAALIAAQNAAMSERVGLWKNALGTLPTTPTTPGAPVTPGAPTAAGFAIDIVSVPSNAKLYIDNIDVHHRTPSDEKELKKQLSMLTPGPHKFSVSKSMMYAETTVNVVAGANEPIVLTLK
jgi:endonuclease YncB( thermonuclease family)